MAHKLNNFRDAIDDMCADVEVLLVKVPLVKITHAHRVRDRFLGFKDIGKDRRTHGRRHIEKGDEETSRKMTSCPSAPASRRAASRALAAHVMRGFALVYIY